MFPNINTNQLGGYLCFDLMKSKSKLFSIQNLELVQNFQLMIHLLLVRKNETNNFWN